MVQRLRLRAPNAGGLGLIPGQGIRSCVLQLRHSAAKYINKQNIKKKEEALSTQGENPGTDAPKKFKS